MKIKKITYVCINILFIYMHIQYAETGKASIPIVNAKVFDKTTGTLYLGTEDTSGSIYQFLRYDGTNNIFYSNFTSETEPIEFLTLATTIGNTSPILGYVLQERDEYTTQTVNAMTHTGSKFTQSPDLKDASGAANQDGKETTGIVALAANENYIFAAVKPSDNEEDDPEFGDLNSGIAVVEIDKNKKKLSQIAANNNTGADTGIKAKKVDETTDELGIAQDPIIIPITDEKNVSIHWDDKLQRLYIGIRYICPYPQIDAGARSIIVARINCNNGALTFSPIAPDNAFTSTTNEIVGALYDAIGTSTYAVGVHNIRTMHTSTGRDYLIVNGGNDVNETIPGNVIYALPLYNKPSDEANHGTLARKYFQGPVESPGQLTTSDELQAQVGQGPLPLEPNDTISDIVVIGDTVYVSINKEQNIANNEAGIIYCQAMFNEIGIIQNWTPWTKRAFPFKKFLDDITENNGAIQFFDVDAYNGKVWAVATPSEEDSNSYVATTVWVNNSDQDSLVYNVNQDLPEGNFSVLDLDQSTHALGEYSPARYALFGGFEKVVFAKISRSYAQTPTAPPYNINPETGGPWPQEVITNFSCPQNYLITKLPRNSGCVKVMEFSRNNGTESNYFFAGTDIGLYAFTNSQGAGFTINADVDNLNDAPFVSRSWQKIDNIPGSIIDLKTSGKTLYILTFRTRPLKHIVYRVDFEDDITDMFTSNNIKILAESSTSVPGSDLHNAKMFFGIQIMQRPISNNVTEQLALASNYGVFISGAPLGINNANNQQEAFWEPVDTYDTAMYNNIFGVDSQIEQNTDTLPSTIWPIQVVSPGLCNTFDKNEVTQLSGTYLTNDAKSTFDPSNYSRFALDPIIHFWTDGARRFFSIKRDLDPASESKLFVIPYNTREWNITNPSTQMLMDQDILQEQYFYWTKQIGISGLFMAGTNDGIISLE